MALPEVGVKLIADNEGGFLRALNRSTKAVNSFESAAGSASSGTIALGTAIGNLAAGAIRQVAGLMTKAAGAAFSFVSGSVDMAAQLEAQMSGVAAVLGVGNAELEQLNDLVIDLGIDPNLKVSSVEAAQAIEVLAKNGLTMSQIMEGAARQTVFLANATGADFAAAADIATDTMSIFGFRAEDMGDAVNGMAAVVQSSKFDINDYGLALANAGSTAASVGVSFEDFNTAIAAISPSFSSGMTAGTGLKNLLLRLVPNTEKAGDEMRALGLITEDGSNIFFDASGNMKSMAEISGALQMALSGLSEEQRVASLRTIFGNDAMGAAIALANVGEGAFNDLAHSMSQVDAGQAASTRVNNLAGAMDILDGTVEAVRLQIGDAFIPIVTVMARNISDFVDRNAPMFVAAFQKAADFINTFVLAMKLGVGPIEALKIAMANAGVPQHVIDSFQSIVDKISDFINKTIAFVTEHKDALIGAFTAIAGVITATAIIALIAKVGAAIAALLSPIGLLIIGVGLLGAAWNSNWGNIQEVTKQSAVIIVFALNEASKALTAFFNDAKTSANLLWRVIKFQIFQVLNDLSVKATEFVTNVGDKIAGGFIGIKNAINDVIGAVSTLMSKFGNLGNSVPGILNPGSPTPFETGLRGVADAMREVNNTGFSPFNNNGIAPPASAAQITRNNTINNSNQSITLNNNFSNQPQITDMDVLTRTLATV